MMPVLMMVSLLAKLGQSPTPSLVESLLTHVFWTTVEFELAKNEVRQSGLEEQIAAGIVLGLLKFVRPNIKNSIKCSKINMPW